MKRPWPQVELAKPDLKSLEFIAKNLRQADRQELETASGISAPEALKAACFASEFLCVGWVDECPAFVFGVAGQGVLWMCGTDAISTAVLPIFRLAQKVIAYLLKHYPRLHNQVDCRNRLHLRWLRLLGFSLDGFTVVNGITFRRFHMDAPQETAPCVNQPQSSQASDSLSK